MEPVRERPMMPVIAALHAALAKYPLMQPLDVCKLLYQSVFGPSHFKGTAEESLAALKEEMKSVEYDESEDLYEMIGDRFVRLNLAAVDESWLPLETVNEDFTASAETRIGSRYALEEAIAETLREYEVLPFAFEKEELTAYMEQWKAAGYPVISHSPEYKKLYAPHYRVVEMKRMRNFMTEKEARVSKKRRNMMRILTGVILIALAVGMAVLGHFLYYKLVG